MVLHVHDGVCVGAYLCAHELSYIVLYLLPVIATGAALNAPLTSVRDVLRVARVICRARLHALELVLSIFERELHVCPSAAGGASRVS